LTTSSLEALKAYSLGADLFNRGMFLDSVGFFKAAIELDPNFGYAYDSLAVAYMNSQQRVLAKQLAERAFALRDRVSELEKFRITYFYHNYVRGDLERAAETLELYAQAYPRDYRAQGNLANLASLIGQHDKGLAAAREALRLKSPSAGTRVNLAENLLRLNRYAEAKEVSEDALQRGLDTFFFHNYLYSIAFINSDDSAIQRQLLANGR
jgi:tetratricopeptide (TPR) repeat protein